MTFTTFTFVFFVGGVFAVYWSLGRRQQNVLLLLASYVFYGWWDYRFCALMGVSSLVDYWVGLRLADAGRQRQRRLLLATSLLVNLGMLGFFKYFNFFAEGLVQALDGLGWQVDPFGLRVVLPVGISFYTFQTLSYTLDVYFRKMPPTREFVAYMAYVSFFPQLVAGPIERAPRLLPQFLRARSFDPVLATDGCRQILWGFFKKMVLADNLALIVDQAYGNVGAASGPELAFATVCFAFQIYCDFAGYSDIAIGTAKLFGIDLMRNFAYPYFSQDPAEFWRRWHISLSTWFRDYVFVPLGGSRATPWRTARNVMVTFVVSGLWHGAAWNFVIWGALNGLAILPLMVVWPGLQSRLGPRDRPGGSGRVPSAAAALRILTCFGFICFTWIFFRAESLGQASSIISKIAVGLGDPAAWAALRESISGIPHAAATLTHLGAFVAIEWLQRDQPHALVLPWGRPFRWLLYTVLLYDIVSFGTHVQSTFLYFQF